MAYIKLEDVLNAINDIMTDTTILHKFRSLRLRIGKLPTADVEEVKHGEWIYKHRHRGGFEKKTVYDVFGNPHTASIDNRYECDEPYCSVCGKLGDDFLNYCGNCGAKMDGGKEE